MNHEIFVSAVVLRDDLGRVLLVRKRGTQMWMNPGGKPEAGESPAECAVREVREELGLTLDAAALVDLGRHESAAANEEGYTVVAQVFEWPGVVATPEPSAEIAEVRWFEPGVKEPSIAPLFTEHIAGLISAR